MATKPDIRSFCNEFKPSYSAAWQRERLTGEVYEDWDALLKSMRPGSIVEVVDGFLLAPVTGKPAKRRDALLERVDAVKAKKGILHEVATGHRSNNRAECNRMLMRAYEMIATSGRGRKSAANGRLSKSGGRPTHRDKYTDAQWASMGKIWDSRKYDTAELALAAIHALGIKVKRGYMYTHFGKRG
jgi:hypothetical protein